MPGILIVAGVIALYLITYTLNKNTDAPMEMNKINIEKCGACSNYGCGIKQRVSEER